MKQNNNALIVIYQLIFRGYGWRQVMMTSIKSIAFWYAITADISGNQN
jgi:hypothetical protein